MSDHRAPRPGRTWIVVEPASGRIYGLDQQTRNAAKRGSRMLLDRIRQFHPEKVSR